jgi:hypothetical protein
LGSPIDHHTLSTSMHIGFHDTFSSILRLGHSYLW